MKPIFVLVAFYVFVLLLLAGTCYVVFVINKTPWIFGITLIVILECKPKVMNVFKPKSDE